MNTNKILGTLLLLIGALGTMLTGLSAIYFNVLFDNGLAIAHLLLQLIFVGIATLGGWMLDNRPNRN